MRGSCGSAAAAKKVLSPVDFGKGVLGIVVCILLNLFMVSVSITILLLLNAITRLNQFVMYYFHLYHCSSLGFLSQRVVYHILSQFQLIILLGKWLQAGPCPRYVKCLAMNGYGANIININAIGNAIFLYAARTF